MESDPFWRISVGKVNPFPWIFTDKFPEGMYKFTSFINVGDREFDPETDHNLPGIPSNLKTAREVLDFVQKQVK